MRKTYSCCILILAFILSGCATKPIADSSFSDKAILLEQINTKVRGDTSWFNSANQAKQEFSQKYKGEIDPVTAFYLEHDSYIYEDEKLSAYLSKIISRLLQGWEGLKPELSVVIVTDEFFNAYVDELNQVHVTTGLLRNIENEDQLASILAHEISHVLLRHNPEKSSVNTVNSGLEWGVSFADSVGSYLGGEYETLGKQTSFGFTSLGLVWADLLSPSWSRKNELEADKLGMDLLIRANYNYEQFPVVLEKIIDGQGKASEHFNKIIKKVETPALTVLTKTIDDEIASRNKSHEDRATRINALKTYLNTAHGGGELPPTISDLEFKTIISGAVPKARLNEDLKAIETINALNFNDSKLAKTRAANILINSKTDLVSSRIAKSAVEILDKDSKKATNNLFQLVSRRNAPAEAYMKLASLYTSEKNYSEAERVLLLGVKRIGRDYKFLPALITVYKASGNTLAAEKATIKCREYDNFREKVLDSGNSYYRNCASVLGYDVDKNVVAPVIRDALKTPLRMLMPSLSD